jgi:hypothetical protein
MAERARRTAPVTDVTGAGNVAGIATSAETSASREANAIYECYRPIGCPPKPTLVLHSFWRPIAAWPVALPEIGRVAVYNSLLLCAPIWAEERVQPSWTAIPRRWAGGDHLVGARRPSAKSSGSEARWTMRRLRMVCGRARRAGGPYRHRPAAPRMIRSARSSRIPQASPALSTAGDRADGGAASAVSSRTAGSSPAAQAASLWTWLLGGRPSRPGPARGSRRWLSSADGAGGQPAGRGVRHLAELERARHRAPRPASRHGARRPAPVKV